MISPQSNHDSQGSGEQWGRDQIYPDTAYVAYKLLNVVQSSKIIL
jgi:hypothetical protein